MNIEEFVNTPLKPLLNDSHQALFAVDLESRILWISQSFTRMFGYAPDELIQKPFRSLLDIIEETETGIRCRIMPGPGLTMNIVERSRKEGIHALIRRMQQYGDFSVWSINLQLFGIERIHQHYEKELFAVLDSTLHFEDFGVRLYYKLLTMFGDRRFRGTALKECLIGADFQEWEKTRKAFLEYVLESEGKNDARWELAFDSQKHGFPQLFSAPNRSWNIQRNSVRLAQLDPVLNVNFLMSSQSFDFFHMDYRIEYRVSDGAGGVFMCGIDNPFLTPDENGYLVHFHENMAIIKRNANAVNFGSIREEARDVVIIKTGPVVTVSVNGQEEVRHIDEIPFYSDYQALNRFGLITDQDETYLSLVIRTRPSVYDYDKMKEFRRLVRFKNDEKNYYEMQIMPGFFINTIKNMLLMRELSEVARAEERMAAYKKERDRALIRLANTEKGFYGFIGSSPAIENIISTIKTVASSGASVLITGETGTGKDLVAKAIHLESGRKGPFVKIDCASLPPTLIESELFGYEKGAFTGADRRQIGKFELAHRGTVFLDEIGNLTVEIQTKLLRFLQDHQFERIGGKTTLKVDVRIVSATNADLEEAVAQGRFRPDLYYRIKVVGIHMPPLRERLMDIYPIVNHLIATLASQNDVPIPAISNMVFPALMNYSWPGNVRELKNAIENALVVHREGILTPDHFPMFMKKNMAIPETAAETRDAIALQKGRERIAGSGAEKKTYRDKDAFLSIYNELHGKPHKMAVYFGCSYNTIKRYMACHGLIAPLDEKIDEVIASFQKNDFSMQEFVDRLNISKVTGWKYLGVLCGQGKIVKQRLGRTVYFRQTGQ